MSFHATDLYVTEYVTEYLCIACFSLINIIWFESLKAFYEYP